MDNKAAIQRERVAHAARRMAKVRSDSFTALLRVEDAIEAVNYGAQMCEEAGLPVVPQHEDLWLAYVSLREFFKSEGEI
jgi:hypothetical protein